MFKLVVSLALLAVCSAYFQLEDADYRVGVMRNHLVIAKKDGHEVHIAIDRENSHHQQIFVQVLQRGQVLREEQLVNEPVTPTGQYQADILYQIFENFKGTLDVYGYQRLVYIVAQHVKDGHVSPVILVALQTLADQQTITLYPFEQQFNNAAQMFQAVENIKLKQNTHRPINFQSYGDYQHGYGDSYGIGRLGHYYPETYGQEWTRHSYYGPYTSNLWNRYGQGYGYHHGYVY